MLSGFGATMMLSTAAIAGGGIPDATANWDHLWNEVLIDLTVLGSIFMIAAIYMLIKYRTKDPNKVGSGPKLSRAQSIAWALIPTAIFLADDFYLAASGWSLWQDQRTIPENAMEVKVTGYQWYWEFEYEDGTVTEELVVPVGTPVVLRMTSEDVVHSFGLHEYRMTEDLMPGRVTYMWFYPQESKETFVSCREFCGISHSEMFADVKAVKPAEFTAWLAKAKAEG